MQMQDWARSPAAGTQAVKPELVVAIVLPGDPTDQLLEQCAARWIGTFLKSCVLSRTKIS